MSRYPTIKHFMQLPAAAELAAALQARGDSGHADEFELLAEHSAALVLAAALQAELAAAGLPCEPRLHHAADGATSPVVYLEAGGGLRLLPVLTERPRPQLAAWFAAEFPCAGYAFAQSLHGADPAEDCYALLGYAFHGALQPAVAPWTGLRLEPAQLLNAGEFAQAARQLAPETLAQWQAPAADTSAADEALLRLLRPAAHPAPADNAPAPAGLLGRVRVLGTRRLGELPARLRAALGRLAEGAVLDGTQRLQALARLLDGPAVAPVFRSFPRPAGAEPANAPAEPGWTDRIELPGAVAELHFMAVHGEFSASALRLELLAPEGSSSAELAGRLRLAELEADALRELGWLTPTRRNAWQELPLPGSYGLWLAEAAPDEPPLRVYCLEAPADEAAGPSPQKEA